tara:strand:+ start:3762 stop:4580 length:819 start_codon:yes stop_codon:yes gene_type:complete
MKKSFVILLIFIVTILFNSPTFGQKTKEKIIDIDKIDNFHDLEKERLKIITDMYAMMYEISGLFTELERAQGLEKLLNKNSLTNIENVDVSSFSEEKKRQITRLKEIKSQIILPELRTVGGSDLEDMKSISATEGFRRIIENKVQDIVKKTDQLSLVGTKVTELNNTSYVSQNFKKQISWSFALLVGLVISGFFIIAYKDAEIRKTIFSGDVGLQFITIFSIIIAIILFGITEVLGGKEIAALIGGISGYILGRSSIPQVKKNKKSKIEKVL